MPTPTGMLSSGDRLIHPALPKMVFEVTERTSNAPMDYAVWLKRDDGKNLPPALSHGTRRGREYLLLNAGFLVFRVNGGWKLIDATKP